MQCRSNAAMRQCASNRAAGVDDAPGRPQLRRQELIARGRGSMRSRNHKGNVFVGNLPTGFTDERLAEVFDPFGMVLSAAIARDPNTGARLRYGFVDIATEKAAKAAIAGLDGTQVEGSKLSVQMSEKPGKKAPGAARGPGATKRPPL